MKIKSVCDRTGLTERTIRFYIEKELIRPEHVIRNNRVYYDFTEEDVKVLEQILVLRKARFSIDRIKEMQENPLQIRSFIEQQITELRREKENTIEVLRLLENSFDKEQYSLQSLVYALSIPAKKLSLPEADQKPDFSRFDYESKEEKQELCYAQRFFKEERERKRRRLKNIVYYSLVILCSTLLILWYTWGYLEQRWQVHHSVWKLPLFGIFGAIIVLVILILVVLDVLWNKCRNLFINDKEISAKLITKTEYPYTIQKAMVSNSAGGRSTVNLSDTLTGIKYELSFLFQDGKKQSFLVPKHLYETMEEGKEGTLRFHGQRFLSFGHITGTTVIEDEKKGFVTFSDDFHDRGK